VSILSSLAAPPEALMADAELFAERVETTVSSLLSLLGINADPIQSPEHILLSNILNHRWRAGEDLALEHLIRHVQNPPFKEVGVMSLEMFLPEKDRLRLAMQMNNLLASPGFAAWMEGEPLDIQRMYYTEDGRARISIFNIAHLGDAERMFFVSLLFNQVLGWMRQQSGTSSLRALLYMDEIYGYLPPTATPPSKKPLMVMLKQGRAFGLGILLATQNPVDLDYKALSNTGTWFLGRLQTERDKARVLDGLEGAAASHDGSFDKRAMGELLAGLGARVFLMNNVNEDRPRLFHVRWVMSYLCGPLGREQIKRLIDPLRAAREKYLVKRREVPVAAAELAADPAEAVEGDVGLGAAGAAANGGGRASLPRGIESRYYPVAGSGRGEGGELVYQPALFVMGTVRYGVAKHQVYENRRRTVVSLIGAGSAGPGWDLALAVPEGIDVLALDEEGVTGAGHEELPPWAYQGSSFTGLKAQYVDWLYRNHRVRLLSVPGLDLVSRPDEGEGDFLARVRHALHEARDAAVAELQAKARKRVESVERGVEGALMQLEAQKGKAGAARIGGLAKIGGSLVGALMGKRVSVVSATNTSAAERAWREQRKVGQAKQDVERAKEELARLERELEQEVEAMRVRYDPDNVKLEAIELAPYKKDCVFEGAGFVWMPFWEDGAGRRVAAWDEVGGEGL